MFRADPAFPLAPRAILGLLWIGWAIYWIISAGATAPTRENAARTTEILHRIPLVLGILSFASGGVLAAHRAVTAATAYTWRNIVGLLLLAGGLAFAIWARSHLGKLWSARITLKTGHRVIQTGPYAIVRHPIYSGVILALLGTAICLNAWSTYLGFALITLSLVWKLALEECWLIAHLGDAYREYRREVKALIPFVL